jgi:hypothetical protein
MIATLAATNARIVVIKRPCGSAFSVQFLYDGELIEAGRPSRSSPASRSTLARWHAPLLPGNRLSQRRMSKKIGAGDGIRTHDPNLGKVVLYP